MKIYNGSYRRIGICIIIVSILDLIIELGTYYVPVMGNQHLLLYLQTPAGIIIKDVLGILIGVMACVTSQLQLNRAWIGYAELLITAITLPVIVITMHGATVQRLTGLMDITWILMIIVTYTGWQIGRVDREWRRAESEIPSDLDIMLKESSQWFDDYEIGPSLVLNREIAAVIDRHVLTLTKECPLSVTVQCPEDLSESLRDTFREVLVNFYEGEEHRVANYISRRYSRMVTLIIISAACILLGSSAFAIGSNSVVGSALSAFVGFTFAHLGLTFYEISDGHKDLIRARIAKLADVQFL